MFHTTAGGCDSDEGLEIHFTVPCSTKQKDRLVNSLARHLARKVNKERDLLKYRCSMCIARKGMRKQAAKQVTKNPLLMFSGTRLEVSQTPYIGPVSTQESALLFLENDWKNAFTVSALVLKCENEKMTLP